MTEKAFDTIWLSFVVTFGIFFATALVATAIGKVLGKGCWK